MKAAYRVAPVPLSYVRSHCSVVWNIMLFWTALERYYWGMPQRICRGGSQQWDYIPWTSLYYILQCVGKPLLWVPPHCWTLTQKCRHADELCITENTSTCHNDNSMCDQRRTIHQPDDISISEVGSTHVDRILIVPSIIPPKKLTWLQFISVFHTYAGKIEGVHAGTVELSQHYTATV